MSIVVLDEREYMGPTIHLCFQGTKTGKQAVSASVDVVIGSDVTVLQIMADAWGSRFCVEADATIFFETELAVYASNARCLAPSGPSKTTTTSASYS